MKNFAGWFAAPRAPIHERAAQLWPGAAIVDVHDPFQGVALRAVDPHPCIEDDEARFVLEFGDPLLRLSQEFTALTFVYIEMECWGGACLYSGEVFQGGKIVAGERGEKALTRLLQHLGVKLDDGEYFAPLDRSFSWGDAL